MMNNTSFDSGPPAGADRSSQPWDPRLWQRPIPVGYGIGFTAFATIAAPLLAGFSLTTIVTLSSSADHRGSRGDIAIAAFSIATVLMLFTLQAGLAASQRAILPDQRAAQYPEARHFLGSMHQLRLDQWRDENLAERLIKRCRWTYNLGIIAFLGGLIALQIPSPGKWDDLYTGSVFRMVALVAAIVALLVEIVLTFHIPVTVSNWLVPGLANPQRARPEDVPDMEPIEPAVAQRLAFGDFDSLSDLGSDAEKAATAIAAISSALDSLATRLADLNRAVESSVNAAIGQAERAQAQLAPVHKENVEDKGPGEQHGHGEMGDFS
jgi:hypothetical protein